MTILPNTSASSGRRLVLSMYQDGLEPLSRSRPIDDDNDVLFQEHCELLAVQGSYIRTQTPEYWIYWNRPTNVNDICCLCQWEFVNMDSVVGRIHICGAIVCDICWNSTIERNSEMIRCPNCRY